MRTEPLAPPGWVEFAVEDAFQQHNGPLFVAQDLPLNEDEPLRLGFWVAEQHCGFPGICHGGMIAMVLDNALGRSVQKACETSGAPTISLHVEYLGAAALGDWIQSRVRFLRRTRSLAFVDGTLMGPSGLVAKATGIWKLPSPRPAG